MRDSREEEAYAVADQKLRIITRALVPRDRFDALYSDVMDAVRGALGRDWRRREPFELRERAGARVCEAMAKRGVLTRPIGSVVVLMPPYCTTPTQVGQMVRALRDGIDEVFGKRRL